MQNNNRDTRDVLGLYHSTFRLLRKWPVVSGQTEHTILNEARMLFGKTRNLTDTDLIKHCVDECTARIEIGLHYQIPYPRTIHPPPRNLSWGEA